MLTVSCISELQPEKALSFIMVMLEGIVMLLTDEHPCFYSWLLLRILGEFQKQDSSGRFLSICLKSHLQLIGISVFRVQQYLFHFCYILHFYL